MGNAGAKTAVTGSAGGSSSVNANSALKHCSKPLGTLMINDGRDEDWYSSFRQNTQINDVEPMIRLMIQQSNCFVVSSSGNTQISNKLQKYREKARNSGEMRSGSKTQKGQVVVADYFLDPTILFANSDAGALGGVVGAAFGSLAGAAAGAVMTKSHTTVNLTLIDYRSEVQIAASEGSASTNDFAAGVGALFGGVVPAGLGGYTKTPGGKAVVAAFVDAYNQLVDAVSNYKAQQVEGGLGKGGALKVGD